MDAGNGDAGMDAGTMDAGFFFPDGGMCIPVQAECTSTAQCCDALDCAQVGGLSVNWCCVQIGGTCNDPNDCCGQLLCNMGTCQ
jgi:hypothetical protein